MTSSTCFEHEGSSSARLPWLRFFRAFSSVVRQMPGLNSQVGARSALFKSSCHCVVLSPSVVIVLCCYLCCSVIMVLFYVLIVCTVTLPPGVNPIVVDKYIYIYISIDVQWQKLIHSDLKPDIWSSTILATAIHWFIFRVVHCHVELNVNWHLKFFWSYKKTIYLLLKKESNESNYIFVKNCLIYS